MWLLCLAWIQMGTNIVWEVDLSNHDLFRPGLLATTDTGRFIIFDRDEYQFLLFAQDGSFIKRFAGKGRGPGELQGVGGVGWFVEKGEFWATDYINLKATFWDEKGQFVREFAIERRGMARPVSLKWPSVLVSANGYGMSEQLPEIKKFNLQHQTTRVLWSRSEPGPRYQITGKTGMLILPWTPRIYHAGGSDFFAMSFIDDQIRIFDLTGKPYGKSFNCQLPPIPMSDKSIESSFERYPRDFRPAIKAIKDRPDYWPKVAGIKLDPKNRIWVFGQSFSPKPVAFSVFDRSGKLLRKGRLGHIPRAILADGLLIVRTNEAEDALLIKLSEP